MKRIRPKKPLTEEQVIEVLSECQELAHHLGALAEAGQEDYELAEGDQKRLARFSFVWRHSNLPLYEYIYKAAGLNQNLLHYLAVAAFKVDNEQLKQHYQG